MASKKKVILLVDDDIDMINYLKKLLLNIGHEVHSATTLKEAQRKFKDIYPHLIFLDINLEDENGFQFIEYVRNIDLYKRIKIIMISSLTSKKALAVSKQYETDGYLVKPINNDILMKTIRKIMPSLELPTAKYLKPEFRGLMGKLLGSLTKISEVKLTLRSKVKFTSKQKLKLDSNFIKKLDLGHAQFIIQPPSRDVSTGTYDTEVQLIGLNDSDLREIRKIKTKKD